MDNDKALIMFAASVGPYLDNVCLLFLKAFLILLHHLSQVHIIVVLLQASLLHAYTAVRAPCFFECHSQVL